MQKVAVVGAGGRMGQEVCRAVSDAADLELVAAVDPNHVGEHAAGGSGGVSGSSAESDVIIGATSSVLRTLGAEVVVDFSVAEAARDNLAFYAEEGLHAVIGTTGLTEAELAGAANLFAASEANAIVASNFAIGAVLLMRFSALAAPHMDGVEVIELHHDAKRDAPSGTALHTAEGIAEARTRASSGPWPADPTTEHVLPGARGGEGPGGVRVHSVRLPGLIAHEEVIFGAVGQSLSIRHDSYDRRSFMPGVLLAVRAVPDHPGLTVGIEALLGL
jgi:4-hydroxy-tetrahydrodipicolinate reductase